MNFRALLELCRISNLPTVWSNAVLGWLAGTTTNVWVYPRTSKSAPFSELREGLIQRWPEVLGYRVVPLALIFSLLYCGGMILNDYLDRSIDAQERPNRPIPSGRVSPQTALILGIASLLLGFAGMTAFEWQYHWIDHEPWRATAMVLLLCVVIVMYNLNHTRSAMSVLLMGLCRALIILSVATVVQPPVMHWAWWFFVACPAATLMIYTVLISIVARNEMQPRWFGGPKTVMNMIAAMPLLDAVWLIAMGLWPASLFCVTCAGMTKLAHRKVAGS